ncbi:hypothetical protein [Gryllotalpicola koreensis]|uniref:Uncharacterized protein n=1 Tax=Gryllotalpicola koreensis TaxID=993086 RepID=A0ABP7ZQS9_9MICO
MITIESHPPQSTVTTVTIDLTELPQLGIIRRLALALSLVLITSVEPRPSRRPARSADLDRLARIERERQAELMLLSTIPRR